MHELELMNGPWRFRLKPSLMEHRHRALLIAGYVFALSIYKAGFTAGPNEGVSITAEAVNCLNGNNMHLP